MYVFDRDENYIKKWSPLAGPNNQAKKSLVQILFISNGSSHFYYFLAKYVDILL